MITDQRFRKSERLCRKKYIEELFRTGKSFYSFPFRLVWIPVSEPLVHPAQITISVKKRLFRKAVQRNLLKRRIREAYRKNKTELYLKLEELNIQIVFILIYTASDIRSYLEIEEKIIIILSRLKEELARSVYEGA